MSNDKREQQMMAAAEAYVEESEEIYNIVEAINDFCAGWRAADNNSWIPVEERLPEENTAPLVRMDLTEKFGEETILYDVVAFDGNGFHTPYRVTHWMEITPPVKKGGNDENAK